MGDLKNSVHQEEEKEKNPIIVFFSNLLGAIKLPFPPKKENGAEIEPPAASSQAEKPIKIKPAEAEDEGNKPGVVTFPRQSFEPLKLEAEAEEAERSTNPVLLWQQLTGLIICYLAIFWCGSKYTLPLSHEVNGQKSKQIIVKVTNSLQDVSIKPLHKRVYAIGGFFILRWAWTRWNERKGPKKPDDQPPPAHD